MLMSLCGCCCADDFVAMWMMVGDKQKKEKESLSADGDTDSGGSFMLWMMAGL
jgi:hypothetical protein